MSLDYDLSYDCGAPPEGFGLACLEDFRGLPPGSDDYTILLATMDSVNQGFILNSVDFQLTQEDIDFLYPKYTYAQIAWMFMVIEDAHMTHGVHGTEAFRFDYDISELRDIFGFSEQMPDSQVLAEVLNVLRVSPRRPLDVIDSAQNVFLRYRQMLTIKNYTENVIDDTTTITAGAMVDHSLAIGNYATQVMFTAIPNDRPLAVIDSIVATEIEENEALLTGINFDYLLRVYLVDDDGIRDICGDLIIIDNDTATCIVSHEFAEEGWVKTVPMTVYGDYYENVLFYAPIPE
jgi:hypothetical protein